ncbi:unnamed protein product [Diamesa serratosioi]
MSTSTNSEATINTSTESASTHFTNITTTTDTENCDSLDLGDGDSTEQNEPLLSSLDDSFTVLGTSESEMKENSSIINVNDDLDESITPLLSEYESFHHKSYSNNTTNKMMYPHTAPLASKTTESFTFDPPASPKSARNADNTTNIFTFEGTSTISTTLKNMKKSPSKLNKEIAKTFHEPTVTRRASTCERISNIFRDSPNKDKTDSTLKSKKNNSAQIFRKNSVAVPFIKDNDSPATAVQTSDLTMFPFDREAIDYERIQRECFAVEEEYDGSHDSKFGFPYDTEDSPTFEVLQQETNTPTIKNSSDANTSSSDVFHQYTIISQQENERQNRKQSKSSANSSTSSEMKTFSNKTTTESSTIIQEPITSIISSVPDLKVNLFVDSIRKSSTAGNDAGSENKVSVLDACQKKSSMTSLFGCRNTSGYSNNNSINLTSNPMETAVCVSPRAVIVVQQASLSLDCSVETVLLKNECDFISVEYGKEQTRRKKLLRDENIKQLLDVTNMLTNEEMRDFEMKYGSPHHSRSQSVKTPGSRASGRPNQLCLPQQRSRVASMPNTGVEEEYYRLRHFSITGKGIVNRGDSLKSRRSRSNNSVASSNSSTEYLTTAVNATVESAKTSLASSRESNTFNHGSQAPFRVLMLGGAAVGKSSLVSQFMTSEYLHAYDTSIDDDSGEKSVSVLLGGEESEITFIDHGFAEMTPENCISSYDPQGYCVIYSSSDRSSFHVAERILQTLWMSEHISQKAVILVGNKADLVRSRTVTCEEGKSMATAYDCKYIETSVGINHNVDELLVGLLTQIRLKLENPEKSRDLFRKRSTRKSKRRACSPLGTTTCLSGVDSLNASSPVGLPVIETLNTPPCSAHNSPRKYRGSRTSASLKVKGLLGRVWARDSKSKSCENLHVL